MAKPTIVDRYFQAFNAHDPEAVAELFGRPGKYVDPAVPAGVKGGALIEYLRSQSGTISWLHGYFDRRAMLRQLGL